MAVRKRNGVYFVDFRYQDPITGQGKRFRRTTGRGTTKKEARELEIRWRQEVLRPPAPPRKRAAFSGFAKHYLDTRVRTACKPSTVRSYEQILRVHLVPFFGDRDLREIDSELVAVFKATKAATHSAKSVNNMIGVASTLFKYAVRWRYCEVNPVTGIGLLKLPPQEFSFWDREQSDAFLAALEETEPRWLPFFLCALRTGMRLGELFALRWDDVDFVKGQVRVVWNYIRGELGTPKSGHGRSIPMSPRLAEVLRDHRHLRGPLVFCTEQGDYLTRDMIKRPFERAVRKAGLPMIRLHDQRHSFASQLVMAGVPLVAVQQYLGHSELSMTMRYAHLSPAARQAYVQVLDGEDVAGPPSLGSAWAQSGHKTGS